MTICLVYVLFFINIEKIDKRPGIEFSDKPEISQRNNKELHTHFNSLIKLLIP